VPTPIIEIDLHSLIVDAYRCVVGNKRFREMVAASLDEYIEAGNRFEKSLVIHRIVDQIQAEGGRFLKKDTRVGKWCELTQQQSKEKVGHAIRDAANLYLSRQQKEEARAFGEQLGSGHIQDTPLKSAPTYTAVGYDNTASKASATNRQSSTGRASFPSSVQHSLEAEADAFNLQFSSKNFLESPIERTTPRRLLLASNVANPYDLSIAQSRMVNRQPELTQPEAFRHQQSIHQSRQQAIRGDRRSGSSAYMTHTGMLNLSDHSLPLVPQHPGYDATMSAQLGATIRDQTSSRLRQQQLSLPYPPTTNSVARDYDPYDRLRRDQMLLLQGSPDLHYRQRSQQPHDRIDDNDHFLDVINAVLGPIGHDTEDDVVPTGEGSVGEQHIPQPILFDPQIDHPQPGQAQFLPDDNVEDERKPSPKGQR
jgi:hypothetical protein